MVSQLRLIGLARSTVKLPKAVTPDFMPSNLWPLNSQSCLQPGGLQDLGTICYKNGWTRPKSRTSVSYENALWTNGIRENLNGLISAWSIKPLESGKKRLWACVVAEEGQFEHKMWTFLVADVLSCVFLKGGCWLLHIIIITSFTCMPELECSGFHEVVPMFSILSVCACWVEAKVVRLEISFQGA